MFKFIDIWSFVEVKNAIYLWFLKKKILATLIQNRMLFSLLLDTISPKYHPLFTVKVWMLKCEKKIALLLALASYQFKEIKVFSYFCRSYCLVPVCPTHPNPIVVIMALATKHLYCLVFIQTLLTTFEMLCFSAFAELLFLWIGKIHNW